MLTKSTAPEHVRRLRPYQPGKPVDTLARELGLDSICQLASNENTAGPSPKVAAAIQATVGKVQFYPDGWGHHLKARLAALHGVAREQIVLGNGSGELVDLICRALVAPGERVVMARLGFVQFRLSALAANAELVEVEPRATSRADDPEAMARASRGAKVVFLANPNNPTGTYWTRTEVERYFAAADPGALTVIDQAYFEYVEAPGYPNGLEDLAAGRDVLVLRTFSKIHALAGLRIGYGISAAERIMDLERVRAPFNTNAVAQAAALAALDDEAHVAEARRRNSRELAFLSAELERRGAVLTPSVTNFVLADFPGYGGDLAAELAARGVLVRGMAGWGLPGSVRITVGTRPENERLLAALDQALRP